MYIKRILRVLIPGSPCPCRTPRIPVSFVPRVPVSVDLANHMSNPELSHNLDCVYTSDLWNSINVDCVLLLRRFGAVSNSGLYLQTSNLKLDCVFNLADFNLVDFKLGLC